LLKTSNALVPLVAAKESCFQKPCKAIEAVNHLVKPSRMTDKQTHGIGGRSVPRTPYA